jgi:hypothetical protein
MGARSHSFTFTSTDSLAHAQRHAKGGVNATAGVKCTYSSIITWLVDPS